MKLIALKVLPNNRQPGDVFDVPDHHAKVLILAGAAKLAEPDRHPQMPQARRSYRRRDLTAEDAPT